MPIEYRGCRGLVVAQVLKDNADEYVTGPVYPLAPVAEISKEVDNNVAVHYYDNHGAIIIDSEGNDTVTFTCAIPSDEVYALITGRTYDTQRKRFIENTREERIFAVGYIIGEIGEGDEERYIWRYHGMFGLPTETSATKDDGTDANNISLVYTGDYTNHVFENGRGVGDPDRAKAQYIRKSDELATPETYFASVVTPDTDLPAYSLTITEAANTTVTVTRRGQALSTGAVIFADDVLTISVTGGTVKVNGTNFTSGNTYTVTGNTTVVSTASA